MRNRIAATVLIFLGLALAGCSTPSVEHGVSDGSAPKIQRVGVASRLGDTFEAVFVGLTIFGNDSFSASVPGWNMDQSATEISLRLLQTNANFQPAPIDLGTLTVDKLRADQGALLR